MSFILDALKKSETDRQHQGSTEFAGVPTGGDRRQGPPAWLWVVGVLLVINLAVLVGILMRPDTGSEATVAESAGQPSSSNEVVEPVGRSSGPNDAAPAEPATDFASQVAAARENAPPREEPASRPAEQASPAATGSVTIEPMTSAMMPTIHEVQARGLVSLPPLHVDIHVYSESAEDRFVFINMVKHKEGSRLAEGPLVSEITPDGVILEQNGTTFLLPRD